MQNEVYLWTKRPDLAASTQSAIRNATLKYHRKQKFFKDLVVQNGVANPTPALQTAVIPISTFPQWRQFKSIKLAGQDASFGLADPDVLVDQYGYSLYNIYLVAGTNLNVKSAAAFAAIDVTYYQDPIVWPSGAYSSWIANEQPDLIICAAAAQVLSFDNEQEIFKTATIAAQDNWLSLLSSNTEEQGR